MIVVPEQAIATQRFKLAVILDKKIEIGGGFNQSLNAAHQILRIAPEAIDVEVFTTIEANIKSLAENGLVAKYLTGLSRPKRSLRERLRNLPKKPSLSRNSSKKKQRDTVSRFELEMQRRGIDVVYFTSPSRFALELQTTPYIFTIWDLCHLEHPEFPEVTAKREFEKREELYSQAVPKAFLTITDSEHTTELASFRYRTRKERFLEMPFAPAPFLNRRPSPLDVANVLNRYGLMPGYLFYPAQFWAHKNHTRLLQAAALLKKRDGRAPVLVFAGGDQGFRDKVETLARSLGVLQTTHFLGFVPSNDMSALYEACHALAMPSYFGPSNLPPMEAWALGKPVIYPECFAGFSGQAALLFDPDDIHSLAQTITAAYKCGRLGDWNELGAARLAYFAKTRSAAEDQLSKMFIKLHNRL